MKWNEVEEKKRGDYKDKGTKTSGIMDIAMGRTASNAAMLTLAKRTADTTSKINDDGNEEEAMYKRVYPDV